MSFRGSGNGLSYGRLAPRKLLLGLKEEMEVCASGIGSLRSRARKGFSGGGTACAALLREEHTNNLVRLEWRL